MPTPQIMKVDRILLEKYYDMWVIGSEDDQIKKFLGISDKKFDELSPAFHQFCKKQAAFDTKESLTENGKPTNIELTDARRKKFLDYVAAGLDKAKVAKVMGIPLITVTNIWEKEDEFFLAEVEEAREMADVDVIMATKKRATGYEYIQKTVTEVDAPAVSHTKTKPNGDVVVTEQKEDEDGDEPKRQRTTTTTYTTKTVLGDTNAQKFWLINRKQDKWSLDGLVNNDANIGVLLKVIRAVVNVPLGKDDNFEEDNGDT